MRQKTLPHYGLFIKKPRRSRMIEKDDEMYCDRCGTKYKRYFDPKREAERKIDGEAMGLHFVPGTLCCPKCYPEKFKNPGVIV